MWKVGDRVLARRRPESFWYPGTVRHIDGPRYYLIFEDGEDGFVSAQEMTACRFEPGDRVQVYQASAGDYLAARVVTPDGESVLIRYPNHEEQSVALARLRIQPEVWKQPDPHDIPQIWSVADRVLACWYDLDWYPAVVLGVGPGRVAVLFDTGAQAELPAARVRPFRLAVGDRVLCRRQHGKDYYAGMIAELEGERVRVRYDDGTVEETTARLLRLRRDDWLPTGPAAQVRPGTRVLAQGHDFFYYPARVLGVEGKKLYVRYGDGDQGLVTPDQVRRLDVGVGSRVSCRRAGGPNYLPGRIADRDGDRIQMIYDDGQAEWTSLRLVRVEEQ